MILMKEQLIVKQEKEHNYTPKVDYKSKRIAKSMNLDNELDKRF